MQTTPRIGATHEMTFTVDPAQTIAFAGLPPVLATPWLIWHLEHAALDLLQPYLDEGEVSVGTHVELDHLAPTLSGATVTCRARVIHVDGPTVVFQIEAHDGIETVSRGLHRRHVVEVARLSRRLLKKTS